MHRLGILFQGAHALVRVVFAACLLVLALAWSYVLFSAL